MTDGYLNHMLAGAWLSLQVALAALAIAMTLGVVGAMARLAPQPALRASAEA